MSKFKPLDESNILNFLASDSISNSTNDDPITESQIQVTLDDLQPFELNPRRSKNPKYDEIRDSIEEVGLKFIFHVTRRHPSDEKYSIKDGGNTRLEILWELYLKYKSLAEKAKDEDERQKLLARSDSFYRIKCVFIPFQGDLDALTNHMIENEARGGSKFIERALTVAQYKRLFRDNDEREALASGKSFDYTEPSSRALAKRISELGWVVDHSHIVRYNYAVNILINYIPDALWAGAGHSVARKISTIYRAYNTFWEATEHGREHPDEIEELFYSILSEFDGERVDFDGFIQQLDIRLEEIVNIPAVSIMAEINALMSNSKRSLQHEPNALKERLSGGLSDSSKDHHSDPQINNLPLSTNTAVSTDSTSEPVKAAAKNNPATTRKKEETGQGNNQNSQISGDSTLATETPSNANNVITNYRSGSDLPTMEDLPDDIEILRSMVMQQVRAIEGATTGFVGVSIATEPALINDGILYDVWDFYDPEKNTFPVQGVPDDDARTVIWWQLQKNAQDYMVGGFRQYSEAIEQVLHSYIVAFRKVNPNYGVVDVILYLEQLLLQQPKLLSACFRLQLAQAKLIKVEIQNQTMD